MDELLVKMAEEGSELAFAALKYRKNPSPANKQKLRDEIADVLAVIQASELGHNKARIQDKTSKYSKLKGKKHG